MERAYWSMAGSIVSGMSYVTLVGKDRGRIWIYKGWKMQSRESECLGYVSKTFVPVGTSWRSVN